MPSAAFTQSPSTSTSPPANPRCPPSQRTEDEPRSGVVPAVTPLREGPYASTSPLPPASHLCGSGFFSATGRSRGGEPASLFAKSERDEVVAGDRRDVLPAVDLEAHRCVDD